MDHSEEQQMEIEALQAILEDDIQGKFSGEPQLWGSALMAPLLLGRHCTLHCKSGSPGTACARACCSDDHGSGYENPQQALKG